jgi:Bacterial Ig-like domain
MKMETDRTSRHPIRFTTLVAIAAALATIALVLASSGNNSALAATSLVNGNFETGNLTGWTVDTTASGGTASAVASYDYCSAEGLWEGDGGCGVIGTMNPKEGSYFALLTPGTVSEDTMISQPFGTSDGDKVSGWAFFRTGDYLPYDHKAQVVIKNDSGTTVATPFEESVSSVGQNGNSGWKYWEYTFSGLTGTGQFHIEARVHNTLDSSAYFTSAIGLDDVNTCTGCPDTTPPETSITSGPAEGSSTTSTSATFEFSSNEKGSTFKCQLSKDGAVAQAWADCMSPTKSYSNLTPGNYKFEVQATDLAGNVDQSPASRSWTIDTIPDTTAPSVMSTAPTADATGVGRTANVTASFSEDMSASSIDGQTLKLFKQGSTTKIAATISYHPDPDLNRPPHTAILDPTNSLQRGVTYRAVVTTGAKDLAGNPLAQNYRWFFTVGK